MRGKMLAWGLAVLGLLAPVQADAVQALLVGVSSYPGLDQAYQLEGPRHDVQRLRDVLLRRGVPPDHITVLADGVSGSPLPTRARIVQALADLADRTQRGDTVLIYLSGHGSQQPADPQTPEGKAEPDGLTEIFLPADVGRWDGKTGRVRNAITKYELRTMVDAMLAKGAFVWGIFDACHSATLVRSAPESEVRFRHVAPTDLGIPEKRLDAARARPSAGRSDAVATAGPDRGGSVFFYAAQSTELTPEMHLPLDDPREVYGLFSFMLTQGLSLGRPMSYRQLAQYLLTQYGGITEARVTPQFSGSALDQLVLGQQTVPVRQWPASASRYAIADGRLSDLAPKALFALVPGPLARTEEATGYFQASQVELTTSTLTPVAQDGHAAPTPADIKPGSYWRLVSNPQRYALRVALDDRSCRPACPWAKVLGLVQGGPIDGADVEWVSGHADIVLQVLPDRILLLSPAAQGQIVCASSHGCAAEPRPIGTPVLFRTPVASPSRARDPRASGTEGALTDDASASRLKAALHAIAKSTNLSRLALRLAQESPSRGLKVQIEVQRPGQRQRTRVLAEQVPVLQAGDQMVVTLTNEGLRPIDVTLLYADARFGISALFPSGAGELNRLAPHASLVIPDIQMTDADGVHGIERLMVIAVEAERLGEHADFSFLSQPPLAAAARVRGGPMSDTMQAFVDAAYASRQTRGATVAHRVRDASMQVFTLNVQPAAPHEGR